MCTEWWLRGVGKCFGWSGTVQSVKAPVVPRTRFNSLRLRVRLDSVTLLRFGLLHTSPRSQTSSHTTSPLLVPSVSAVVSLPWSLPPDAPAILYIIQTRARHLQAPSVAAGAHTRGGGGGGGGGSTSPSSPQEEPGCPLSAATTLQASGSSSFLLEDLLGALRRLEALGHLDVRVDAGRDQRDRDALEEEVGHRRLRG